MSYNTLIVIHTFIGFAALITFWIAAIAQKGSALHRTAGKLYILSMLVILASVVPMIIVKLRAGSIAFAVVLLYLFCITATAVLVAWSAIRKKKIKSEYQSLLFKFAASVVFAFGLGILSLALIEQSLLYFIFSTVGIFLGGSMWWNVLKTSNDKRWFLAEHLNGVAVLFAATHGSFLRFGLSGIFPIPDSPELNTFTQMSMILLAYILRAWLGRKFLASGQLILR